MKFAATTALLFAALAIAEPVPIAEPKDAVAPQHLAREVHASAAGILLEARDPKKSKGGSGSSGNNTDSAAGIMAPSRVLELGALGLGVALLI